LWERAQPAKGRRSRPAGYQRSAFGGISPYPRLNNPKYELTIISPHSNAIHPAIARYGPNGMP